MCLKLHSNWSKWIQNWNCTIIDSKLIQIDPIIDPKQFKNGFTNAKIDSKDQKEELQTQMYFKIVAYWYFQTVAVLMNVFATSLTISPAIPKLGK